MLITRRLRRLRSFAFGRELLYKNNVSPRDMICPVFVRMDSMVPDSRLTKFEPLVPIPLSELENRVRRIQNAGIGIVALFPVIVHSYKDDRGSYSTSEKGNLMVEAIQLIRDKIPEMGIMCDVALDPFTNHGHDGVLNSAGAVDNDETVFILTEYSMMLAQAGCQILAPSDMMDGRVGEIRKSLEKERIVDTIIFSYTKFLSSFYQPFRIVLGSDQHAGIDKSAYQLHPSDWKGAVESCIRDIREGADAVIIKPASLYLDVCTKIIERVNVPVILYQVSGEYTALKEAMMNGWLPKDSVRESFVSLKRAGGSAIISYFALEYAESLLRKQNKTTKA